MAVPSDPLPGYLNHLTQSQETKLRELWILLFTSAASVLSAVYDVPIPEGSPHHLFEALDNIQEPSVDAILAAINNKKPASSTANNLPASDTNGEQKEQKALDKMESLINKDAEKNIMSEMASRKVTPEHFSALFKQLRDMGVPESEIQSMKTILSKLGPEQMVFAVLKMIKQEHPDALLLRFLRARKWDVGKAFAMMTSAILWRKEIEVDDDIMPKGELHALQQAQDEKLNSAARKEGQDFIAQFEMGKSYLHGFDKQGRPIGVVRVRLHKPGAQSQKTLERYIVHTIETTRILVTPPVETGGIVFDMTGFGLSNMEYSPVKFIIKCFEANYPESLGILLIHNAPWIFSGFWKIIHGWMDPVVASKVHFTRSVDDLEKFIPRENIPKELGGEKEWEYEYVKPKPDENTVMQDTKTRDALMFERMMIGLRLLATTAAWISATTFSEKEDEKTVKELKTKREAIVEEFQSNYWKLDPYVRARALIDRTGVLEPDGTVTA
ncbi:uncharacterized protein PFLUO_LOCUS1244 [Penicillium psychrofluorescens]|uniref:uncharacterized protein n=1 Tax=Penicillium psychrofluorescens TaxID=3158075 RepID=UPI003CCD1AD7